MIQQFHIELPIILEYYNEDLLFKDQLEKTLYKYNYSPKNYKVLSKCKVAVISMNCSQAFEVQVECYEESECCGECGRKLYNEPYLAKLPPVCGYCTTINQFREKYDLYGSLWADRFNDLKKELRLFIEETNSVLEKRKNNV